MKLHDTSDYYQHVIKQNNRLSFSNIYIPKDIIYKNSICMIHTA
jgi:hypothetical protein